MAVIPSQRRHSTEEQGASGGEQDDDDGASYRGIAAGDESGELVSERRKGANAVAGRRLVL